MDEWKFCKGCRHLTGIWCHARDDWQVKTNQITGHIYRVNMAPFKTAEKMRIDGPCGKEATLYQHKFWRRLWLRLTN